ncbi:MAG: hypothetical protein IJS07_01585 [Bacteroidales bacterium]|nr:hypothetical protein [Bacteroidales bacterium]
MEALRTLGTEELSGIVDLYPWFAAARKELCVRMGEPSGAALYVASRALLVASREADYRDESLAEVIRKAPVRRVHVVGGDFFSQEQYDEVRKDAGQVPSFRGLKQLDDEQAAAISRSAADAGMDDFCTETLAQIYIQQGYYDQAKYIYSKLSLRYPEKNTYFAALIEKLDSEIKN